MDTMKAVAAMGDGSVRVVDVERTRITDPYQCLVRITACGLCSSTDMKIIGNGSVGQMPIQYPTLIGHEAVGVIEEVGEKVRYWKKGDRLVSPDGVPVPGYFSNWGAMNGYGVTTDLRAKIEDGAAPDTPDALLDFPGKPIPEGMSDVDAVMLLTLKENYSALLNFGVGEGTSLLIYGDGAVALGLAMLARHIGAANVACIGHHDDRLERIRTLAGVDKVVNSHAQDPEQCLEMGAFDVVIDAAGSIEVVLKGARFLRPGGLVGCYGVLKQGHSTIDLLDLPNNVRLQTLNWPYHEHRAHDAVVRLVQEGKIDLRQFYSHVLPVTEAPRGVEMIRSREAFKVIFTM